jgi:hypothetical protein
MAEILLALVPLLVLLAALLLGHYPGHEAAMRLGERIAAWRHSPHPATGQLFSSRSPDTYSARGGLLLAFGLSGRAPPA